MSLLSISADLPNLDGVIKAVEKAQKGSLRYAKDAVRDAMNVVQNTWIQYASGATVSYSGGTFTVNVVSGQYLRSIQNGVRWLDDLTGEVFSDSPHGAVIEDGSPPRDMKEALLGSPKAKQGKNGRYITVPFRHGTPGAVGIQSMPQHIYSGAKNLGYSRRNGFLKSLFTGSKYTWGGKFSEGKPKDQQTGMRAHNAPHPGAGYQHRVGIYEGMVKMGRKNHSQYMTFRRVSENSDPKSWMFPGVKPRPIREAVVENTREEVLQLIRRGFEMDLYFMGLGGD